MWKVANVTSIFKKENKQLVKKYRLISLILICGEISEKLIVKMRCDDPASKLHGLVALNTDTAESVANISPGLVLAYINDLEKT